MGTFAILTLFARTQFLRALTPRRSWIVYAFTLTPTFIALLFATHARRVHAESIATNFAWFLFLQVVVPLVSLLQGQAVIAREVEDRTITYLFSRPIARPAMFLGRTLGALAFTLLLLLAGAALLMLAAGQGQIAKEPDPAAFPLAPWTADGVVLPFLVAVALGALAYTTIFSALGVFTKHPMIAGLAYTFAIEAFLANLPGSSQALTVQYYLRSWIAAHGAPSWAKVEGFDMSVFESPMRILVKLGVLIVLALLLGVWRIRRREFVLSS